MPIDEQSSLALHGVIATRESEQSSLAFHNVLQLAVILHDLTLPVFFVDEASLIHSESGLPTTVYPSRILYLVIAICA